MKEQNMMDDQHARTFVAALAGMTPEDRVTAWTNLTPDDRVAAWNTMTPDEQAADNAAWPGEYWWWLTQSFENSAAAFRAAGNDRAAVIADQLVATADNVSAELMSEWYSNLDTGNIHEQMLREVGRGEFTPDDATVFVREFIRRVSGVRAS
jgi:hypothetical protein